MMTMNKLRTITLSLLMLALVAGGLPVTDTLAKWGRPAVTKRKKNKKKRRSRAWWRRYRTRLRARRERAMERRPRPSTEPRLSASAATNTSLLAFSPGALAAVPAPAEPARRRQSRAAQAQRLPFEFTAPYNWGTPRRNAAGDIVFSVRSPEGRAAGLAVLAPVSLRAADLANAPQAAKTKTVGGAPVAALRRTVIDRMVAEGGWVTNDFVQEMQGRRVFVVLAQTGAPGAPAQSLAFYFTEIDGRVYSLATTGPVEFAAPLAAGSEQFMASLQPAASRNTASQR
jgi:hypothetical protein